MNRMYQADDIMREYFQQHLVLLRHFRLATDEIPELALHRGERRLDIAALVIVGEKFIALETVEVKQTIPRERLEIRFNRAIAAEWDKRLDAHVVDEGDHFAAVVSLVRQNLVHRKVFRRPLKQRLELSYIVAVAVCDRYGGHDMRLDPYHRVNLDVVASDLFMPILGGVVAVKPLQAETSRIDCEVGFDRAKRQAARRNEILNDRRDILRLDHVEDAVVAGRVSNESLRFGLAQVCHETTCAEGGIDFERCGEQRIANRETRATTSLRLFGNSVAQIAQQTAESSFLGGLRGVVLRPVLRVVDADRSRHGGSTIFVRLALHCELNRESVFALHAV